MNPAHWLALNPDATYLGQRRGWPAFRLPNDVHVLVTSATEHNLSGVDNFNRAVARTSSRRVPLHVAEGCPRCGRIVPLDAATLVRAALGDPMAVAAQLKVGGAYRLAGIVRHDVAGAMLMPLAFVRNDPCEGAELIDCDALQKAQP